jgi:hypothetical protein
MAQQGFRSRSIWASETIMAMMTVFFDIVGWLGCQPLFTRHRI